MAPREVTEPTQDRHGGEIHPQLSAAPEGYR